MTIRTLGQAAVDRRGGFGGSIEPTYRVSELAEEIRDFLAEAYPSVWVSGEVQRARQVSRGHFYFELVEKGDGDAIVGKLDAVAWRTDYGRIRQTLAATGQEIVEGLEIRCRVSVDFYPPGGRLQLVVREVDALFSLGMLERRRRETLAMLEAAGLLDLNRGRTLPAVPLRIGLVTSEGSAAWHDFLSGLRESGFGFEVWFVHAAVQGKTAETEIAAALRALGNLAAGGLPLDVIALVRGGGSRSDLAAFDSRAIAEAVARCPVPVLTGLGHEIDASIADRVAHGCFKTPTKVAEFLVARATTAEISIDTLRTAIAQLAERRLRLASETRRQLALRLAAAWPRTLERARREPLLLAQRLAGLADGRLREKTAVLDGIERLCRSLAPERTLERGFSITRSEAGLLVRRPEQTRAGERLQTRVAGGILISRVEET